MNCLSDNVTNPQHYTGGGIETIDFMRAKMTPHEFRGFCIGNIIKYVTRARNKNGLEDFKKARRYLDFLIEAEEK